MFDNRFAYRVLCWCICFCCVGSLLGCGKIPVSTDTREKTTGETTQEYASFGIPSETIYIDADPYRINERNVNIAADIHDRLYLAGGNAVHIFAPDGSELGRIEGLSGCYRIAARDERLYAFDERENGYSLYVYDTETVECIASNEVDIHGGLSYVSVVDDRLVAVSHGNEEDHYGMGYWIDPFTGETTESEYAPMAEWVVRNDKGILWGSSPMMLQADEESQPAYLNMPGLIAPEYCATRDKRKLAVPATRYVPRGIICTVKYILVRCVAPVPRTTAAHSVHHMIANSFPALCACGRLAQSGRDMHEKKWIVCCIMRHLFAAFRLWKRFASGKY